MPDTDFAAWQDRVGLANARRAAAVLGITRQSATDLRAGRQNPSPPLRRLMQVIEDNPELLEQLSKGDE